MTSKWKLSEIIVLSVLAVVFAVVYLAFFQVGNVMAGMMGPIGYEWIFGIWFIVSIIAAYILRRPGAAFLSETIAGIVEVLIGNAVGPMLIVTAMIQGAGAEAVFAATRYKRWGLWVLMLAGMGSAVTSFIWGYFISGYGALDPGYVAMMFAIRLVSGALLAGLLGKWISDGLYQTGVLGSYAIARDKKRESHAKAS